MLEKIFRLSFLTLNIFGRRKSFILGIKVMGMIKEYEK